MSEVTGVSRLQRHAAGERELDALRHDAGEAAHGAVKRLEESRNLEVILTSNDEAAVEINEVSEQAGLVSQATEPIQPFSHDVSLIRI